MNLHAMNGRNDVSSRFPCKLPQSADGRHEERRVTRRRLQYTVTRVTNGPGSDELGDRRRGEERAARLPKRRRVCPAPCRLFHIRNCVRGDRHQASAAPSGGGGRRIRLLHRLVGDEPDAFNLIGDGQQSIYPGGYTLGELGISIAGRGVVMTRNYRNTREIASFAASLVGDSGFVDIESGLRGRMDAAEVLREGAAPSISRFPSVGAHDAALVARVRELLATPGVHPGDIAVLAMRTREVSSVVKLLGAAGVPVVELAKYDGRVSAAVKVGTIKRAKGLEFKHVLVAHTPARLVGPAAVPENGQDAGERVEMERRELYVAMTRARDGLWVGVVAASGAHGPSSDG
jgi:hypothetical protein